MPKDRLPKALKSLKHLQANLRHCPRVQRVHWSTGVIIAFLPCRKAIVWSSPQEEFEPNRTISTIKHGGGNAKCWACFLSSDLDSLIFIDSNTTCESYRELLENKVNLLKFVEKLGISDDWIFQHDNDPKRRTAIFANRLNRNRVERLH